MAVPILHWRLLSNCRQCGWLYKWNIHPNWQACFLELKPPTYTVPINIVLDLFDFGCDCCGIESGDNTLYLTNNIYIHIDIYVYIVCFYLDTHWWMLVVSVPEKYWTVKESKHLKIPKSRWRSQRCNLRVSGCERALLPWHWLAAYSFVEAVLRFERRFGVCLMEIKNEYVKNYCFFMRR